MSARLWITRTQPGANRQAAELEAAGYTTLVAPVLRVEATGAPLPGGSFDAVVFLSEHAVNFAQDLSFCTGARLFAIGPQTGAALEAAGYTVQVPPDPRSEGLLELPEFATLTGQRVLLVAGEGGRELLADTLKQRGAAVCEYRCYRRVASPEVEFAADQIDVIIAASGDGVAAIADCWFARAGGEGEGGGGGEGGGEGGGADIPLLVPSPRVARLAAGHGFSRVIECSGASSRAILSALQRISVA